MKYRTETRTREVLHTEGGETRLITEEYTVGVPVIPRDWDRIVLNAATGAAMVFTGVSLVWSTVSAGALLDRAAPAWAAYPVALAYDGAWLTCMGLEWHARHDPDRARAPRLVGYAALAIAMAVIYAHGAITPGAGRWVGLAGAVISAIAKTLWVLVLRHTAVPLSPRTQAFLRAQRSEAGGELAFASTQRDVIRMREQHAALIAANPAAPLPRALQDSGTAPVPPAVPAPSAQQDNVPPPAPNPAPVPPVRGTQNSSSGGNLHPIAPAGQSLSDAVRTAIAAGVRDKDAALDYVRKVRGPGDKEESVVRLFNRHKPKAG